jgi:transposase
MLAELVDHVIGIDPDRDWITAAVVDAKTTGVIATAKFAANNDGYDEAIEWADVHTTAAIAAGSWRDPAATDAA